MSFENRKKACETQVISTTKSGTTRCMDWRKFKDVFAWTYKYMKKIPLELAQHRIELDITIPPTQ
jgi:hypothetical protein